MTTSREFTDEDHERALRAGRYANARAKDDSPAEARETADPDSDWSHTAAGYITLGVIFAVVGTVIEVFLHGPAQGGGAWWWLGGAACLAWGFRLARKNKAGA